MDKHRLVLAFHHLVFVSLVHCFLVWVWVLVWFGFFDVFLSDTGLTMEPGTSYIALETAL